MKPKLIYPVLLFIFALAVVFSRQSLYSMEASAQAKILIPPPPMIEHFAFGFKPQIADFLWIRAIQDFDYCEATEDARCQEGWLFQMLDTVTNLTPDLRIAYSLGATSLSVLVNDKEGASKIFDKGVENFPGDWPIAYRAAYHYLYEVNDINRAAELMWRAARNGAPPWTYSLAARLYTQDGRRELGLRVIEDLEKSGAPDDVIENMRKKIDIAPTVDRPDLDNSQ